MKRRCLNPKQDSYADYGGRGITVCDEWRDDFAAFKQWAESAGFHEDLQIDRIDNDGDYCPDNCRWVSARENSDNRRNTVRLDAFGEVKTISQWSRDSRCAVTKSSIRRRLANGWPVESAIKQPETR